MIHCSTPTPMTWCWLCSWRKWTNRFYTTSEYVQVTFSVLNQKPRSEQILSLISTLWKYAAVLVHMWQRREYFDDEKQVWASVQLVITQSPRRCKEEDSKSFVLITLFRKHGESYIRQRWVHKVILIQGSKYCNDNDLCGGLWSN